ncbi:MAG TPA: pentapeptide repeat-containing protein [Streptosporangiaceae bacterium]|jgi:uncharacterized protein YjbI with pentapeptide repeats|nr:pentapeptide repeat-containing protein [Streptosporangiaceae bacterium]
MAGRKLGARAFAVLAAAALAAGTVLASGSVADAVPGVTCPTVGAGGMVTPAPTPGVDWVHCDLTGANLSGANLSGADLAYADMIGANLDGANLTNANLDRVILKSSNLSSANLTGTTMVGVYTGMVTASPLPTLPAGWQLIDGYLAGPGADLSHAALSGADLSSADLANTYLGGASLTGANLAGADLAGANVSTANLAWADLSNANLTSAALDRVKSGGITGATTKLPADWQLKSGYLAGPGADLGGDNASGVDLSGTDLAGASFYGTDLADANLSHANLTGIDGAGVDLQNANLTDANLTDASIDGIAFGGGAPTLQGADLAGATMTGLISGVIVAGPAVLPPRWMFADGYLLGPTADIKDEGVLQYFDLRGVNLAFANISVLTFEHDNLANAVFWGSNAMAGNFYQDTWSNTICPDGTNSGRYVSGCFSARRYGLPGFLAPKPGATLRKSVRRFAVQFRLTDPATGAALTTARANALAAAHDVRVILAGPRINREVATCVWSAGARYFSCVLVTPAAARTGGSYAYTITAQVNQGAGFLPALPARGVTNPESVHFR